MSNVNVPAPPQNEDIGAPLMGLYLDRPTWKIPPSGFSACNNVRIEEGRVRSDLMGWTLSTIPQLPAACIYLTDFIDGFGNRQTIAATPTDIIFCNPAGTNIYMTPVVNLGNASVGVGSATVTGSGTRWASDILFGDSVATTGVNAVGTTKIYLSTTPIGVPPGLPVTDTTNAGTINPGTYLLFSGSDSGGAFIVLSQGTIASMPSGDHLQFGGSIGRPNVRPGDQIFFGSATQNSITATWYTVASVQSDTQLTLTTNYAGGVSFSGAYTCRQLLTNTLSGPNPYLPKCFSSNFPAAGGFNNAYPTTPTDPIAIRGGDAWFFTNGIDPVVVYNSAYTTSTLYARSISFICSAMRQARGIMVYGGLTIPNFPGYTTALSTSIASSDNGFPLQLAGGVSFQGIAIDGPFRITRLSVLGSSIMLYASGPFSGSGDNQDDLGGAVVSASFVGFPTIWAFSDVVKTRGPLNGGCVAEFPDRHQFLSTDGEYRYNGLFIQVMNDQVWREVLKSYDTTRPGAAYAAQNPTHGDLIWAVPLLTDPPGQVYPSTAYVEHYMEQANSYLFKPMTKRDFPFTCASVHQGATAPTWNSFSGANANFNQNVQSWLTFGFAGNAPAVLAGDLLGNIWTLYGTNLQAGRAALATCTWGSRVIGNARARALVKRVYPEIEYIAGSPSAVTVTLTCYDALGGPVTITDAQNFTPNYTGNRFTTHYRRGRMASVTISDQAGLGWVSDGYDLDWVTGGLR